MALITINKDVCIGRFQMLSDAAKACYFTLLLFADRSGLCDRMLALRFCSEQADTALHELADNGFVLELDGVVAIRHWFLHDKNRMSSRSETVFTAAYNMLTLKDRIYEMKKVKDAGSNTESEK